MNNASSKRFGGLVLLFAGTPVYAMAAAAATPKQAVSLTTLYGTIALVLLTPLLLALFIALQRLARKTAELSLSEQHLQLLGDNLPDTTIFQLECSGENNFRFRYLSNTLKHSIDIDREQVMSDASSVLDCIYETDIALLNKAYEAAEQELSPADLELRILTRSGELRWLHIKAVPHRERGMMIWDGFVLDISHSKNIETTLAEEKDNLEHLFEAVGDFQIVCDMDGRLLHTNTMAIQRLGYSQTDLLEMSLFELYPENLRSGIFELIALLQQEPSASSSLPLKTRSGGTIPVDMSLVQGKWKHKQAIVGIARDIANRKKTESALRQSQQMLHYIMDTIPISVFWTNHNSVFLGCNKSFFHELRLRHEEDVIGKTPKDFFDEETAALLMESDRQVINTSRPLHNQMHSLAHTDGTLGWREMSKIPLHDEEENAVGVLGVWRDVTEQTRAEERLKHTLEDMERFNQLMRGRERRTLQMKDEVNNLLLELGRPEKYRTTMENRP